MSALFAFLFLTGDCALWLGCSSAVLSLFTDISSLLAAAPLMGLGCMSADLLRKHKALRWAGLLPVIPALLLCRGIGDALAVVPCAGYLFMSIRKERTQPEYTELSYRFARCTAFAILGGLLCVWRGMPWGFSACLMYLGISVFLTRMLRHTPGEMRQPGLLGVELGLLGLFGASAFCLSRPAIPAALLTILKKFYFWVIVPLLTAVLYLLAGIIWLLMLVFRFFFRGELEMEFQSLNLNSGFAQELMTDASEQVSYPWVVQLLRALGILAAIVIAFLVFRRLFAASRSSSPDGTQTDLRAAIPPEDRQQPDTPGILDRSPEARVRRAYADYCRAVEKRRQKLTPSDTTRDVQAIAGTDSPDADALRSLYLRCRYSGHAALTRTDAAEAARLASDLKRELLRQESE